MMAVMRARCGRTNLYISCFKHLKQKNSTRSNNSRWCYPELIINFHDSELV